MELLVENISSMCRGCTHRKNFPKYTCKKCSHRYSSSFKLAKEFDSKHIKREAKKVRISSSDERLLTLYSRIKDKYFEVSYLPDTKFVSVQWKRGSTSRGGWCRKKERLIKVGGLYKTAFESSEVEDTRLIYLVHLIMHEAIHLRLAHHKKSFKMKEKEIKEKFQHEDLVELFAGLTVREL